MRFRSKFIFSCGYPFVYGVPAPFVERLPFLHWIAFLPLSNISWTHFVWSNLWVFRCIPLINVSIFSSISHHLDYCSYGVRPNIEWFFSFYFSLLRLNFSRACAFPVKFEWDMGISLPFKSCYFPHFQISLP